MVRAVNSIHRSSRRRKSALWLLAVFEAGFWICGVVLAPAASGAERGGAVGRPAGVGGAAASKAAGIDWGRKLDLNVRGGSPGEAFSQISGQCGVTLLPSKELIAGAQEFWKQPLWLQAKGLTLRQGVEWLCRALGCRYRVQDSQRIVLDCGYSWTDQRKFGMILRNVETLMGPQRQIDDLDRLTGELMKVLTLMGGSFYARLEEHGEEVKLVALMPEALKPFFERALALLESRGETVKDGGTRLVDQAERDLIARIYRPVVAAYRDRPADEIAADLARQGGLNIGFDQLAFRGGKMPLVTLDRGKLTLQQAVEELGKQIGLPGIELSLPGGIWLSSRPGRWTRMAAREFVWPDTAEVRAYFVGDFPGGLDGEMLAHQIRQKVYPDAWLDPVAAIMFHKPSGNLLVLGRAEVQAGVMESLAAYRVRFTGKGQEGEP